MLSRPIITRLSRRIKELLQKRVDDKPTQTKTESTNPEDERRLQMGLLCENCIEILDSFFRLKRLQIEEAKDTNDQAEQATTLHESQHKSLRTRTNPILYSSA